MNENINLMDILKDCPRGTKLYSTNHGIVNFEEIKTNSNYPIVFYYRDSVGEHYIDSVTKDGKHKINYCGECTLFPSKENRDWSKFKILSELIDGEFYYCVYNYNQKEHHVIFIYKKHIMYKTNYYAALDISCYSILSKNSLITNNNNIITELRKATEKEKQQLLYTIEIDGYKWDEDKKELVKIEPKFNINTLQPFDKVLVRNFDNECVWRCTFYECFTRGMDYPFLTMHGLYKQCIPYNDETKHLVRTNEIPPKKYINWEEE